MRRTFFSAVPLFIAAARLYSPRRFFALNRTDDSSFFTVTSAPLLVVPAAIPAVKRGRITPGWITAPRQQPMRSQ